MKEVQHVVIKSLGMYKEGNVWLIVWTRSS